MSISTKSVNTIREDRARILARYKKDQVVPDLVKSIPAKIEDWEEDTLLQNYITTLRTCLEARFPTDSLCKHGAKWLDFLEKLLVKLPTCKFFPDDVETWNHSPKPGKDLALQNGYSERFWLYLPTDYLTLGWVDYSRKDGIRVNSHNIQNGKRPAHTKCSINQARALKNVLTYLRPYSTADVSEMYLSEVGRKVRGVRDTLANERDQAFREVTNNPHFATEIRTLSENGYKMIDAGFQQIINTYLEKDDLLAQRISNVNMVFVRVHKDVTGGQVFDCQTISNIQSRYGFSLDTNEERGRTYNTQYTDADLPQDLLGKISALMMCEIKRYNGSDYIEGVGVRMAEELFYVET